MKYASIIAALLISAACLSQSRTIPMPTKKFPKTPPQITKQDSISDEFGKEYVEREFQGVERDTAAENADFLRREKHKEGKITDPEREVIEFDLEDIIYTDLKDFDKAEAERKKSPKAIPAKKK